MAGRIYTRRGDGGRSDHPLHGRVSKDHPDLELLGTLDELNAHLGLCAAQVSGLPATAPLGLPGVLGAMQRSLFLIPVELLAPPANRQATKRSRRGARASTDTGQAGDAEQAAAALALATRELESSIDALEARLPKLDRFLLPGGHPAAAVLHVARTIGRRAERCLARTRGQAPGARSSGAAAAAYLNRLSDWLFVAARAVNAASATAEATLPPRARRPRARSASPSRSAAPSRHDPKSARVSRDR